VPRIVPPSNTLIHPYSSSLTRDHCIKQSTNFFISDRFDCTREKSTRFLFSGHLYNCNTIEGFKNLPKMKIVREIIERMWSDIIDGTAIRYPVESLCKVVVFTYADLKKFQFTYWTCVPTIIMPDPVIVETKYKLQDIFSVDSINNILQFLSGVQNPFFVCKVNDDSQLSLSYEIETWENGDYLGMVDICNRDDSVGWPLRNIIALFKHNFDVEKLKIICFRDIGTLDFKTQNLSSIVLDLKIPGHVLPIMKDNVIATTPKFTGFERNSKNELSHEFVDLATSMDPEKMANATIDLNLKLMRWRLVPDLNLTLFSSLKCLLIGSGTLGCYVARALIGWGCHQITFVDNGRVSYSNLTRQPLFEFSDYGKSKAEVAAINLRKILPTIKSSGIQLSVPMPGHGLAGCSKSELERSFNKLKELISSHDVVYLLTDSRESRWLPTLLGKAHDKLVMNIALGFDSYLVMRHGTEQNQLGCYYCNDVVAPTDSLKNRTLDQQCTVTRPGLAGIAASFGVELMATIIQHKKGLNAPFISGDDSDAEKSCLGEVPHQLRGFVSGFKTMSIHGLCYKQCTACSPVVIEKYGSNGFDFIYSVLTDPSYLERVTGLDSLLDNVEDCDFDVSE
jgi:ubiquitin-like modifier-activating enzyme ATG7